MDLVAPAVVYSSWNVNASYPSEYVMKATPNGNGNSWGVTISPNGQWTWPRSPAVRASGPEHLS